MLSPSTLAAIWSTATRCLHVKAASGKAMAAAIVFLDSDSLNLKSRSVLAFFNAVGICLLHVFLFS